MIPHSSPPVLPQTVLASPTPPGLSPLSVGQTLTGTIHKILPDGQVLVHVKGQPLLVVLPQPLPPGQQFTATVTQTVPSLVLHLLEETPQSIVPSSQNSTPGTLPQTTSGLLTAARLLPYFEARQPFGQVLTTLETLLHANSWLREITPELSTHLQETLVASQPPDKTSPTASHLQTQVERSGLNYEAQVRQALLDPQGTPQTQNLKGQLLELQRTVQAIATDQTSLHAPQAAETLSHLDKVIHTIEFQQILNVASWQQEQSIVVPLVLPWSAPSAGSNLMIQRHPPDPQADPGGLPAYTLVMTLDVSALGPLRIETRLHGKQVSTTIKAAQPGAADFMLPQVPTLVTALHALGFQAEVGCKVEDVSEQGDPLVEQLAHLQRLIPTRLVDVTL